MRNKPSFKVSEPVVYTEAGGASHSAIVTKVDHRFVTVAWFESKGFRRSAMVTHADAATRIVAFGKSLFLAL